MLIKFYFFLLTALLIIPSCMNGKPENYEEVMAEEERHEDFIKSMTHKEFEKYCQLDLDSMKAKVQKVLDSIDYNLPSVGTFQTDKERILKKFKTFFARTISMNDTSYRKIISSFLPDFNAYNDSILDKRFRDTLSQTFRIKYMIYSEKQDLIFVHALANFGRKHSSNITFIAEKKQDKLFAFNVIFGSDWRPTNGIRDDFSKLDEYNFIKCIYESAHPKLNVFKKCYHHLKKFMIFNSHNPENDYTCYMRLVKKDNNFIYRYKVWMNSDRIQSQKSKRGKIVHFVKLNPYITID